MTDMNFIAAILFGLALVHTFATKTFERLADRYPRHAGLLHFFGEVEVVFGLWALVLILAMAIVSGGAQAIGYAESRTYTEPLFVFVIMVVAASKPVLETIRALVSTLARLTPLRTALVRVWLCLALVPVIGSFITEPAAMTLAALMLGPQIFRQDQGMPEWLKYGALGGAFRQRFNRRHTHFLCRSACADGRVDVELGQHVHGHSLWLEGRDCSADQCDCGVVRHAPLHQG